MNFGQNLLNKVFFRMFDLVVMEGMTLSGHPSIINKMSCDEQRLYEFSVSP